MNLKCSPMPRNTPPTGGVFEDSRMLELAEVENNKNQSVFYSNCFYF